MFGINADKTYTYSDPHFLNRLVTLFSEKDCGLSVCLRPDIQEFIDAAEDARPFSSSWFYGLDKESRAKYIAPFQDYVIRITTLCTSYNIIPFWELVFNYVYREFEYPEIKYRGYNFGCTIYDEPRKTFVDPIHFTGGNKWHGITFSEAKGEESVRRVKLAVARFVGQGYRVTSIDAKLKPRTVSVGTCEDSGYSERCDASLYASNGKIEVCGKVPEDLNIEKIIEIGSQAKQKSLFLGLEQRLLTGK